MMNVNFWFFFELILRICDVVPWTVSCATLTASLPFIHSNCSSSYIEIRIRSAANDTCATYSFEWHLEIMGIMFFLCFYIASIMLVLSTTLAQAFWRLLIVISVCIPVVPLCVKCLFVTGNIQEVYLPSDASKKSQTSTLLNNDINRSLKELTSDSAANKGFRQKGFYFLF